MSNAPHFTKLILVCLLIALQSLAHAEDIPARTVEAEVQAPVLSKEQREEIERQAVAAVPYLLPPEAPATPPPALATREHVKAEKSTTHGGRTFTFQLLDGPPPREASPAPAALATARQPLPETEGPVRKGVDLFLSNTVYDHKLTEMSWERSVRRYQILIKNLDIAVLRGVGRFETDD